MARFPTIPSLAITLMIGTGVVAPSILALGYANYSNRGDLLVRTKGLQLAVFLMLSVLLIRPWAAGRGDRGGRERSAQFSSGCSGVIIIRQTLQRPFRHVAFLAAVMALLTSAGWALGADHPVVAAGDGTAAICRRMHAWLIVVAVVASPMMRVATSCATRLDRREFRK